MKRREMKVKNLKKTTMKTVGTVLLLTSLTASTAFGGTWNQESGSWRYRQDNGQPATSQWILDNGQYYLTDENGFMKTGWHQDSSQGGNWYYLMPEVGAPQGAMKTGWLLNNGKWYFLDTREGSGKGSLLVGWQWIDGYCYYLDPAQGGAMAVSCEIEGGYKVNESGAWISETGTAHYQPGTGISSTQTTTTTAKLGSGSSSGGGGGSSSGGGGGSSSGGGSGSGSGSSNSSDYDDAWSDYSDSSVGRSANDFTNGNYGMMDSSEQRETADAIEEFKDTYITSNMSDFEKEIKIIQWLVENCSYEKADDWANSTAYSCIVNGKAQCSGYADAFLQTAKACGLEVRYISNKYHAWNLIRLDGDWYHVDVTFEDPIGSNSYGFSNLRNKYINLEDNQIKSANHHHEWSPSTIKAKGTNYGPKVVAKYLKDGVIDTSAGEAYSKQVEDYINSVKNEDGSNIIFYENTNSTTDKLCAYLEKRIENRSDDYRFIIRYPSKYISTKTGNYSKVVKLNDELEAAVKNRINSKYGNILKNPLNISIFFASTQADGNSCYYAEESGKLYYKEGENKKIAYTIHFLDVNGTEIGIQSGIGEKRTAITLVFPDGYSWISNSTSNYKVNQGKASYSGRIIHILGDDEVDMNVRLRKKTTQNQNTGKASPSEVEY